MAYRALYRKYRPIRFGDVIGQQHITAILKNQLKSGRIAHAYLFSGSRGTGKTTTARILARAINCLNPADGEPCGECGACSLSTADSIDIIEMDAASNSKVDEMRALLEKAEFTPIYLKNKVYIIDEAHMLSKSADNALLKTLEEPPAHIVFILATTEPQSLPATILSRCQRFDFRRISAVEMAERAGQIAKKEGINADDDALITVARAAEGSMRDCLSILDQCLSFCGDRITRDDVLTVLGSMDSDFLFGFAAAVINSDAAAVMRKIDSVVSGGRDIGVFVQDISNHFRSLLMTKLCGECTDILECTKEAMAKYSEQSEKVSKARLERALDALMLLQTQMRRAAVPRILLESALIKICHPEEQQELISLSDRIDELEKKLNEGNFVPASAVKSGKADAAADGEAGKSEKEKPADNTDAETGKNNEKTAESEINSGGRAFEAPETTEEAEAVYKKFMKGIMEADITIGMLLQLAAAHWCDGETLYLGFDKSRASNYNYANGSEVKAKIRSVASENIAPYGVELILMGGSAVPKSDIPKELFGVAILEE